jgi:cobalt-zinc-cadmium efflux system protein
LAWAAFLIGRRPASDAYSFGLGRFSILVAFINGLSLFLVAALIVKEAFERFSEPQAILAGPMLYVALGGLGVNILVFGILRGADQHNLNIRGAVLHVMGDLLGSVAAILAALTILVTGWTPIDPVLSVFVAVIILKSAAHLVKESAHILLEGSPRNINLQNVSRDLVENVAGVIEIDTIRSWSITPEQPYMTLRAIIENRADYGMIQHGLKYRLEKKFHIHHTNIEIVQRDTQ